jgi:hypothetical protein
MRLTEISLIPNSLANCFQSRRPSFDDNAGEKRYQLCETDT